jgi:hypothetical protein
VDVLVEGRGKTGGQLSGYTIDYLRVHFDASPRSSSQIGKMVPVYVERIMDDGEAIGRLA